MNIKTENIGNNLNTILDKKNDICVQILLLISAK